MTHYPIVITKYTDTLYEAHSPCFNRVLIGDSVIECVNDIERLLQDLVTWRLAHGLELPVPMKICDINAILAYDVVYVGVDTGIVDYVGHLKSSDNGLVDTNLEDE